MILFHRGRMVSNARALSLSADNATKSLVSMFNMEQPENRGNRLALPVSVLSFLQRSGGIEQSYNPYVILAIREKWNCARQWSTRTLSAACGHQQYEMRGQNDGSNFKPNIFIARMPLNDNGWSSVKACIRFWKMNNSEVTAYRGKITTFNLIYAWRELLFHQSA